MNKTTIILISGNREFKIMVPHYQVFLSLPELFENIIEPVLLAAGYSQQTIDDYFGGSE